LRYALEVTTDDVRGGEGGPSRLPVILIVDDEAQLRRSAARILNASGFETILAANGREAITIFEARGTSIDAVLLDMAMPELGGKQTFAELRRIRPDVRVILSSGYDEAEARHRVESPGLAGFLQKPYSAAELVSCLRTVLEAP
jgi:DNA-binding response OmpR family regulator